MWAQYHWYEAEIRLRTRLIALMRISRIRMSHGFANLLTKEKYNFQVVTAGFALIVALSVISPCASLFFFVSVFLNQTESRWRWRQHVRLKRQNKHTAIHDIKTHKNRHFISVHSESYWRILLTTFYIYCSRLSSSWHFRLFRLGTSGSSGQHSASYMVGSRIKCLTKERIFWLRHLQIFVTRSGKIHELILH